MADLYPVQRRGLPLGIVGAVQELGSVLGPLYGALVLAVAGWEEIFWINLAVGLVLAAAILSLAEPDSRRRTSRLDPILVGCAALAGLAVAAVMIQPDWIITDVTLGAPFVPYAGLNRWWSTAGLIAIGLVLLTVARMRPGRWVALARDCDLIGALLLSVALGGVILAFATADPEVQVFSPVEVGSLPSRRCRPPASGGTTDARAIPWCLWTLWLSGPLGEPWW